MKCQVDGIMMNSIKYGYGSDMRALLNKDCIDGLKSSFQAQNIQDTVVKKKTLLREHAMLFKTGFLHAKRLKSVRKLREALCQGNS